MAIHQKRQIHLGLNARSVFDIDAVHLLARVAGLFCDKRTTQHLARFIGRFFHRFSQTNAALFTCIRFLEGPFAASTGVDLRLDDP